MLFMRRGIVRLLVVLALLASALGGRAEAAVLSTQTQTFLGAEASLAFPGGDPKCDTTTKAVDTMTLPKVTLAPVSAATQLAWTPSGNQTSAYAIAVIDPSGGTATTWTIGANSKDQVSFFKAGAMSGAWSLRESGLPSSNCSGGTLIGSPGTASGTASWYQ
jgi:hypothetical protein